MSTTVIPRRPEQGGYRFTDVARMEWIKLRTLRSTGWITLILAAGMVGLAVLIISDASYAKLSAADRASFDPTELGFAGLALGQLLVAVLGVLANTSEFSSGMIRATLAAAPRRPMVLAAKAAVLGVAGLAVGEVLAFAAFLAGQAALASPAPHATLAQPGVLRAVLMGGAYLCLMGLIGLGVGAIIRHTAGAIASAIGLLFVLPIILQLLPSTWRNDLTRFFPDAAGRVLSATVGQPDQHLWSGWPQFAVTVIWALVFVGIGGYLFRNRDA